MTIPWIYIINISYWLGGISSKVKDTSVDLHNKYIMLAWLNFLPKFYLQRTFSIPVFFLCVFILM